MAEPDAASPWLVALTFKDGQTYRTRTLYQGGQVIGIEDRIFRADGTLVPLSGGRTSYADKVT